MNASPIPESTEAHPFLRGVKMLFRGNEAPARRLSSQGYEASAISPRIMLIVMGVS